MPGRADIALASMGIYVFDREFLQDRLTADAADPHSAHDFGKNIIPGHYRPRAASTPTRSRT